MNEIRKQRLPFRQADIKRKPKEKSRMDNPETQTTLGTRHRTKTNKMKTTTQKTKKMSNTNHAKITGRNPGVSER